MSKFPLSSALTDEQQAILDIVQQGVDVIFTQNDIGTIVRLRQIRGEGEQRQVYRLDGVWPPGVPLIMLLEQMWRTWEEGAE